MKLNWKQKTVESVNLTLSRFGHLSLILLFLEKNAF